MKEGMRIWISYTNAWKNHPRSNQTQYWADANPMALRDTIDLVSQRTKAVKPDGSIEFNPHKQKVLPLPPPQKPSSRRIVFSRPIEEIRAISKELFDSYDEKPALIGDECFERVLLMVKKREDAGHD